MLRPPTPCPWQAVRQAGSGPYGLRKFDYGTACPPPEGDGAGAAAAAVLTLGRAAGAGGRAARAPDGGTCNQREYGQLEPPSYNFSVISTPMVVFSGASGAGAGAWCLGLPQAAVCARMAQAEGDVLRG